MEGGRHRNRSFDAFENAVEGEGEFGEGTVLDRSYKGIQARVQPKALGIKNRLPPRLAQIGRAHV